MVKKLNIFGWILTVLATIGALAWGVFGVSRFLGMEFLLVDYVFYFEWLANVIYIIVGLVGLSLIPTVIAMILRRKR